MSESSKVVVGVDFSEIGEQALEEAMRFVSGRPGLHLLVVHVAAGYGPMLRLDFPDDVRTVSAQEAEQFMREHVKERLAAARAAGVSIEDERVAVAVRVGAASEELVAAAAADNADLIVVGTHGRTGMKRLLLGSVAEAVVRKAGCPVLVVRPKDYDNAGDEA